MGLTLSTLRVAMILAPYISEHALYKIIRELKKSSSGKVSKLYISSTIAFGIKLLRKYLLELVI